MLDNEITEVKTKLQDIADYKTKGLILRSQARWTEKGEQSNKYFLQLESRNRVKKSVNKLKRENGTFTTDATEITNMQAHFYGNLYKERSEKTKEQIKNYLTQINTPRLRQEDCEGILTLEECEEAVKLFEPNQAPGNDGIPADFYRKFWPLFGKIMVEALNCSYQKGELSNSQRQAVITLLRERIEIY